jgi:hypothetical protein
MTCTHATRGINPRRKNALHELKNFSRSTLKNVGLTLTLSFFAEALDVLRAVFQRTHPTSLH